MHIFTIILITFVAIQIVYFTAYLVAFSSATAPLTEGEEPVTIVICAHDEEQNLRQLIPILLDQEYSNYEIVIVEDRSNDESFDFLHEASKQNDKLRVVQVKNKPDHVSGKKFALTLGVKAARHEWILLTDADCRPGDSHWIKEMSAQFSKDKAIVIGFSPYQKEAGLLNSFIQYETLFTAIHYMGMALLGKPYMGVGRNLAYRKSLFLENKGFNKHLSITGGDDDLFVNRVSHKNNTAVVMGESSLVYSKPKTNWTDYYYQKLRHLSVGKNYTWNAKMHSSMFHISLIGSWIMVVPATIYSDWFYLPISIFSFRLILLTLLTQKASRKLGDPFAARKAAILDFIFAIYYLVVGLKALQTNKVKWKRT